MLRIGITLATLLVWSAPGLQAQATPAAKNSETPGKAPAPGKTSAKDVSRPAEQAPAAQKKAAAPGTSGTASAPATGKTAAAPAKTSAPAPPSTKTDASAKTVKLAAKQPAKAPALTSAKEVQKAPAASQTTAKPKQVAAKSRAVIATKPQESRIARRDPFESLVGRQKEGGDNGPKLPGKAGLVISTLRLDGIVRAPNAMIAVVSNPQQRTYFLREGDQLYDGQVEKISMDGVSFHENGKDAFGKPVERQVNKRIYPSSGEQQ
jgi:hypothetical protein